MNILSRKLRIDEDDNNKYIEFEVETEKYNKLYIQILEDAYNNKTPFEDTEVYVYSKGDMPIGMLNCVYLEDFSNNSDLEEIYNFILNN